MSQYIIDLDDDELELLRDCVRMVDQLSGDGTANAPTYLLRGKLSQLKKVEGGEHE